MRTYSDIEEMETKALLFNLSLGNWILKTLFFFSELTEKTTFSNPPCVSLQIFLEGWWWGLGGLGAALSPPSDIQAQSWYSLYLALPNTPALWVVGNLTAQLGNILARRKNLEGLEREIQKQDWRHRDKNRPPEANSLEEGIRVDL